MTSLHDHEPTNLLLSANKIFSIKYYFINIGKTVGIIFGKDNIFRGSLYITKKETKRRGSLS